MFPLFGPDFGAYHYQVMQSCAKLRKNRMNQKLNLNIIFSIDPY